MKITILTTEFKPYPGGVATYVYNVANELSKQGHDITILVFFNYGEKVETEGYGFKVKSVFSESYSNLKLFKLFAWLIFNRWKYQPDCWIAADYRTMFASSFIPFLGRKYCVMHGTDARARLITIFNYIPFFKPLLQFGKVVCNSKFTKSLVLQNHKYLNENKVVVSYLGSGDTKNTDRNFRTELNLADKFILLSVGRLERRKGLEYSIKAVLELPENIKSSLVYIIAGKVVDSSYHEAITALIEKGEGVVKYLGVIEESLLISLYEKSNVFLHTAITDEKSVEGFGLVLVEAAKYGLPVITTHVDAIPEVVIDGKTGFVVDEKNIHGISAKIATLYSNSDLLIKISDSAKKNADRFSWSEHVKVFLND